ncbi:hypothetical protein KIN20_025744 [Parelaphostrongylus tenuis]|uniref:Uncharacterized protein n=1 Tax=Parelaphostrongylus tenuis TaxID=148309 RepID=A0AAD5QUN3_PARTN|nr:hypothetical protein KIN20_025744 [Parelaphostrongylus tenuis]
MHECLLGSNSTVASERINVAWGGNTAGKSMVYSLYSVKLLDDEKYLCLTDGPYLRLVSEVDGVVEICEKLDVAMCRMAMNLLG